MQILLLLVAAASSFASVDSNAKNSIHYNRLRKTAAASDTMYQCSGKFEKAGLLDDIGYTDALLEKGVPCKKADFDGDGTPDYWVYKCEPGQTSCKSKVVLMDKDSVKKALPVASVLNAPDILYAKRKSDNAYLERYGCQLPKTDSLLEVGNSEGKENRILELNDKGESFTEFSHCPTPGTSD